MNWTKPEQKILKSFRGPCDVQGFLDSLTYNDRDSCGSPREVMSYLRGHCAEGAYFAAAAIRFMGYRPLIVDLRAVNDDDHLITVYQYGKQKKWGSIAKSNTTMLRSRDPVYKSLRELVMSYFEFYFNTLGEKSLVAYSRPLDLSRFDHLSWMTTQTDLDFIGQFIDGIHHNEIVSKQEKKQLPFASKDLVKACFMGAVESGLYRPD